MHSQKNGETERTGPRDAKWHSTSLEALVQEIHSLRDPPSSGQDDHEFDIVIVGSGYGGAVAASELSGCVGEADRELKICVLERGKEYLQGAFPNRQADLAGHVRFATPDAARQSGVSDGLYDIRWSEDAVALVASGLGGGSLINAGVLEMPRAEVFKEPRWPRAVRDDNTLFEMADHLRSLLGAKLFQPAKKLQKTALLECFAKNTGGASAPTHITVAEADGPSSAGVRLNACRMCGDCATGCNFGAKNSLDLNLLATAWSRKVRLVTGATVLRVAADDRGPGRWIVYVNHTETHLRDRQPVPFRIKTRRLILAAGTLGSTEILLRSQGRLKFSSQLGQKFSANGDMIATAYGLTQPVNAVAYETSQAADGQRAIGPTITSMIDLRTGNPETDLVIQDLAVPGALRRMFGETTTTFDVFNQLSKGDWKDHSAGPPPSDHAAVNPDAIDRSLVVAMIGRDDADGVLSLADRPICDDADGLLTVRWPQLRMDRRFDEHHRRFKDMIGRSGLGGRMVTNLLWRPFSDKLEDLFGRQRGPLITVHPLGGCAMGEDRRHGVTDHCGRVYDAGDPDERAVHPGLVVLDGSIVPTSLGINPSLTISVLALRAIKELKKEWGLTKVQQGAVPPFERPTFGPAPIVEHPKSTLIELSEQVRGWVPLRISNGRSAPHQVEITLTTDPKSIDDLVAFRSGSRRGFEIAGGNARLKILKPNIDFDEVSDQVNQDDIALEADISGEMRLFTFETSSSLVRSVRAIGAWFLNRGLRDGVQGASAAISDRLKFGRRSKHPEEQLPLHQRIRDFVRAMASVCSRAGSVRRIEYDFKIANVTTHRGLNASDFEGMRIQAVKRLTYGRAASPFAQLLQMSVTEFPLMRLGVFSRRAVLELNKRYLARQQIPLLRVVGQQDGVAALGDLLSFLLYVFRVVVQNHALSFRKPDPPIVRVPQRLPGVIPGLPKPEIDWLVIDDSVTPPARVRLARYDGTAGVDGRQSSTRPILLIHGYSASGTTFAHPQVSGNLVQTLYESQRDIWVLDMRCSAGLATADGDWPFEVMADNDISLAIEHVAAACVSNGNPAKVDIVAHCMGAAMFSMALLGDCERQRRLHGMIGRVVFSQVGPVMILSRTNVLAAYLLRYARQFLSADKYSFSPQENPLFAGQLLDRALAAMHLLKGEYRIENPFWWPFRSTAWVGTRHRMDALYGRTFSLKNVSSRVLNNLDDFFGPISLETVSQVIHFATYNSVTDRKGVNHYVTPKKIAERMTFPVMSIHGEENGLVDVATLALMRNMFEKAGIPHLNSVSGPKTPPGAAIDPVIVVQTPREIEQLIDRNVQALGLDQPSYLTWRIGGHGHQDCLIGRKAGEICQVIARYLSVPDRSAAPLSWHPAHVKKINNDYAYQAVAPAFGVSASIIEAEKTVRLQVLDSDGRGGPLAALVIPVRRQGNRLVMVSGGAVSEPTTMGSLKEAEVCVARPRAHRKIKLDADFPAFFDVPLERWPSQASEVLVLLLYDQAEGVGGATRPPRRVMKADVQKTSPMSRAIAEALTYDDLGQLQGGLISGVISTQKPEPNEAVVFALGSCLYPSDIVNRMPIDTDATRGPADASLLALGDLLDGHEPPSLLLLAGDQIYVDATGGLFDPKIIDERYRAPHERRISGRGTKAVAQRLNLDVRMMLDDHEIQDNWAPNDPDPHVGKQNSALLRGKSAYLLYERGVQHDVPHLWHNFNHRGLPFFLADTRTEREGRTAENVHDAKIMNQTQFAQLCNWLIAPEARGLPKFIMSASAVLPRRLLSRHPGHVLESDAWDGYPASLFALFEHICDNEIEGVVFLSGDEHLSSLVTATVRCSTTNKQCVFYSIHSSSLFAPYPFANGSANDFNERDIFDYESSMRKSYHCEANSEFFPGDGFALLKVRKESGRWCLDVDFHDEAGLKPNGSQTLILV